MPRLTLSVRARPGAGGLRRLLQVWLLAIRQRSVILAWPAVVLAALVTVSVAESSILFEFGWLTFVVCSVKASQSLSWRTAFQRPLEPEPLM